MLSVDRHIVTADHHSVSEDVADVTLTAGGHVVAVVADGAGGVAHARAAAELVVSSVMRAAERLADEGVAACARLLANLDLAMAKTASLGQCSAVVLVHDGLRSFGASVGDCWAIAVDADGRLTDAISQTTRGRVGCGTATTRIFKSKGSDRTIVMATDGLTTANAAQLSPKLWRARDPSALARALTSSAGGDSGRYHDDVAVVVIVGRGL